MPANMMRHILRDAIEGFLPAHALDVVKTAEASERDFLVQLGDILSYRSLSDVVGQLDRY